MVTKESTPATGSARHRHCRNIGVCFRKLMPSPILLACFLSSRVARTSAARSCDGICLAMGGPVDPEPAFSYDATLTAEMSSYGFFPSAAPSVWPTLGPSDVPSVPPTYLPSSQPSTVPTDFPTKAPIITDAPTDAPTALPTTSPSSAPTPDPYPENPPPPTSQRPTYYFHYNPAYGVEDRGPGVPGPQVEVIWERPAGFMERYNETIISHTPVNATTYVNNGWGEVYWENLEDNYWDQFAEGRTNDLGGLLWKHDPSDSFCAGTPEHNWQSPIDVRSTGHKCLEGHEIRHRKGDWAINDTQIQKQILPNKLRLLFDRRPGRAAEPDPPHADFPYGWGTYADAIHVDIKIPSEHLIEGKRYPAEYQIWHMHHHKKRTPVACIMVDTTKDKFNNHFQKALDEFQKVWDSNQAECLEYMKNSRRNGRKLTPRQQEAGEVAEANAHERRQRAEEFKSRNLQKQEGGGDDSAGTPGAWDPYHRKIMKSIYFWGYDGSTTDPPCGEWVAWRIIDTPFDISLAQLEQMKNLLFNNVDGKCVRTSVHHNESVARPLQDVNFRPVWRCTKDDFLSDEEAGRLVYGNTEWPSSSPSPTPSPTDVP